MFLNIRALLIIIVLLTIYSCKKNQTKLTVTPASIVGKWSYTKNEQKIYDTTGKLVGDTVFNTTVANYYLLYNANGDIYDVTIQNGISDTLNISAYKLADSLITTDYSNVGAKVGSIIKLTPTTLEIHYQFIVYGDAAQQVLWFHLNPFAAFHVDSYEYYNKQ